MRPHASSRPWSVCPPVGFLVRVSPGLAVGGGSPPTASLSVRREEGSRAIHSPRWASANSRAGRKKLRARGLRDPHLTEVDRRIARLPALEEARDRWMQADTVELARPEEAVAADGLVFRSDVLERVVHHIGREDD